MASIDFANQLRALGYDVKEPLAGFYSIEFKVSLGKFSGRKISIAFQVNNDFPLNPPSGPHISPHLLPITGGGGSHPYGAIHPSPIGNEWQYWSRPFKEWSRTDKNGKAYLAHINNLFATIHE